MILALVAGAFAGTLDLAPAVGIAPAALRRLAEEPALGLAAAYAPVDRFAIELRGLVRVDLSGLGGRWDRTNTVADPARVSPDITTWRSVGSASAVFAPLHGAVNERPFQLRLSLGTGLVHTVEDLRALQAEHDPEAQATARQIHPTIELGGAVRLGRGEAWSMELGLRRTGWIETIESTTLEAKGQWFVTLSPVFHVGGPAEKPCPDDAPCSDPR